MEVVTRVADIQKLSSPLSWVNVGLILGNGLAWPGRLKMTRTGCDVGITLQTRDPPAAAERHENRALVASCIFRTFPWLGHLTSIYKYDISGHLTSIMDISDFSTSVTDSQFPVTDISDEITLWLLNIAMENGSFTNDFDDSPIKNGDSPSYPLVN